MQMPWEKVQTDFHKLETGDWFFPVTLKGLDQYDLVDAALAKGIAGFVAEAGQKVSVTGVPSFDVPNLREYLFALAQLRRKRLKSKFSVIAGSAGKTSVKELVGAILKVHCPNSFMSPDNQNTKIALATQVLRMPANCQFACFEVGARKVHDLAFPLSWLCPEVATLTNIGSAHVGEFGSSGSLVSEKLSVLEYPTVECLVICADDSRMRDKARLQNKKTISFGRSGDSDVQLLQENRESVVLRIHNQESLFRCPFEAPAKGLNVAAAVGTALALGASEEAITRGLAEFSGVSRRFEFFQWGTVEAIDDAFNASPESLHAGLLKLAELSQRKKVLLVLGSMLELGTGSAKAHRSVAHQVRELFLPDQVSLALIGAEAALIGDELKKVMCNQVPEIRYYSHAEAARADLEEWREQFDVVYFKASKSLNLNRIFGVRS